MNLLAFTLLRYNDTEGNDFFLPLCSSLSLFLTVSENLLSDFFLSFFEQ